MKLVPLALAVLSGTAKSRMVGLRSTATQYSVIIGCAVVSAIFLLIAVTIALAAEVGALYACLIMGGVFALISLAGFLRLSARKRRQESVKAEQLLIASSASTPVGAGIAMSAMAFMRGFMNPR